MKQARIFPVSCSAMFRGICENLDSNLGSPQCRSIKDHIENCGDCKAYLNSLKKTIHLYRTYPTPKVPARLRKEILARFSTLSTLRKK